MLKLGLFPKSKLRLWLVIISGLIIIITNFPFGVFVGSQQAETDYFLSSKYESSYDSMDYALKITANVKEAIELSRIFTTNIGNSKNSLYVIFSQLFYLVFFSMFFAFLYGPKIMDKNNFFDYFYKNALKCTIALAVIYFLVCSFLINYIFNGHPIIQDSIAQIFHAKAFLQGKFYHEAPKYPEFFYLTHTIIDGEKWYSQYPPGHIIIMTLALLAKIPYLVNPFFSSATLIVIYLLAKLVFDKRTAFLAVLIAAVSPMMLEMSTEYMNSPPSLFFASLFYFYFFKFIKKPKFKYAIVIGITVGFCFLIRPYSAVALSLPYAIYLGYLLVKDFKKHYLKLVVSFLCFMFFAIIYFYYNYKTTGAPFLAGYIKLWGDGHKPGFGHSAWGEPHSFKQALANLSNDLIGVNYYLGGFAYPVLVLLAPLVVFFKKSNKKLQITLLALPIISLLVFNFFYFYQAMAFGPRFLHEAVILFSILLAYSITILLKMTNHLKISFLNNNFYRAFFLASIFTSCFINITSFNSRYQLNHEENGFAVLDDKIKSYNLHNAIVFLDSALIKVANNLPQNANADVIFARNLGSYNERLIRQYPEKSIYYEKGGFLYDANKQPLPLHIK